MWGMFLILIVMFGLKSLEGATFHLLPFLSSPSSNSPLSLPREIRHLEIESRIRMPF